MGVTTNLVFVGGCFVVKELILEAERDEVRTTKCKGHHTDRWPKKREVNFFSEDRFGDAPPLLVSRIRQRSALYVALLNPAYEGARLPAPWNTSSSAYAVASSSSTQGPSGGRSPQMIPFFRRRRSYETCSRSKSSGCGMRDICDPSMVSSKAEVRIVHETCGKLIGKGSGA